MTPITRHSGTDWAEESYVYILLHSTLDEDRWLKPRSVRFTPAKYPVSTLQKAGLDLRPFWKGAGMFARIGFRTPNRPECSESPYRLRHPSPPITVTRMLYLPSWIRKTRLRIAVFKIKYRLPATGTSLSFLGEEVA